VSIVTRLPYLYSLTHVFIFFVFSFYMRYDFSYLLLVYILFDKKKSRKYSC